MKETSISKPYAPSTHRHEDAPHYPVDVYINYARAMFLEVERRVKDNPPRRPADFWRMVDKCRDESRARLRKVQAVVLKSGAQQLAIDTEPELDP